MPSDSPAATAVAHRLLALAAALAYADTGDELHDPALAAEWVYRQLGGPLTRWFGPDGYRALLARALAQTRDTHPVLAAVRVRGTPDPCLDGLVEAVALHGAGATGDGVAALLTTFFELLDRLLGEEMVLNLLAQAVATAAPDATAVGHAERPS